MCLLTSNNKEDSWAKSTCLAISGTVGNVLLQVQALANGFGVVAAGGVKV